jgi:seryl-tRNA synthetase
MEKQEQINENLQGQINELNKVIQDIKNKPDISVPREERERYSILRIKTLIASLPIADTSTTTNHLQGEIYLTKIGSTSSICSFIDGVQKKVDLL